MLLKIKIIFLKRESKKNFPEEVMFDLWCEGRVGIV
jgi:hypothetical protein